jgi:2,3-bisphosphoglycerate-dependent phosphoglycerate mutase
MAILLVRHGETLGNRTRVIQRPEIPLNEVGIAQAELLAERLNLLGVARILASDLLRAQMTAAPIARLAGLSIESSALLQERNFGDLRGTPYAELTEDPFGPDYEPANGESWPVFYDRVAEAWQLICTRRAQTQGNLVVVTHGFVCRAILARHVPDVEATTIEQLQNTSLSIIEPSAPYRAQLVNCVAHLATLDDRDDTQHGNI